MEDCFVAAQNGQLGFSSDAVDVLLRGLDVLRRMTPGEPNDGIPPNDLNRMVAALEEVRAGKVAARAAAPPPPPPAPAAEAAPPAPKPRTRKSKAKPRATPAPRPRAAAAPPPAPSPAPPPQPAGPPTVRLAGDLDEAAAQTLCGQLSALLAGGAREIRLDLANVNEVDPTGLAVLVRAARSAAAARPPIALTIANAGPQLRTLLRLTRLDRVYQPVGSGS
jgi:anti-anti-sigma factor